MPLEEGYPELKGKKRMDIDPSMTPGKNLDPSIPDERMKDLKKKFFPRL